MFNFGKRNKLTEKQQIKRRTNYIITCAFSALISTLFALFVFEIKNEALASLVIATFSLITITSIIADFDYIKIGVIEIKRLKKDEINNDINNGEQND